MTEFTTEIIVMIALIVFAVGFLLSGIKIIRPTHRAAVETLGKYTGYKNGRMMNKKSSTSSTTCKS